jgi:hypothetical protein
MMGKAPTPFLRFFLETDAIPTLGAIATSGYVTSSPHAFRALINLADNQEISVLLCEQTERFIEFYVGCSARERDFPAGRLCLELLATLAIVSPSYERIAFFLLDVGLPSAIAILAQSREGVEMIAAHSDFCANLPQALRDVERQAVTDTLAIILALVRHSRIADSLLDRPMLFALGTVINCCNEGQAVLAFEILTIVAQHQIGIDMIIQCTNILPMAIAFATNRPYSARIAASNFLASLFVFSTQEVVDRLLICGAADCFVDLIGDFTASAMLFEAIELIIGRGGAKKRLLEALAAVASESEHPRSDIAQSLLALSPTGDRLKWQTR